MPKEKATRGQQGQSCRASKGQPSPTVCKEGKGVRNFACQNYDTCLDKAAKGMWSGFTCKECPLYTQKEDEEASL